MTRLLSAAVAHTAADDELIWFAASTSAPAVVALGRGDGHTLVVTH